MAVDRRGLGLGLAALGLATSAGAARAAAAPDVEAAVRARLARFSDLAFARDLALADEFHDAADSLFVGSNASEKAVGRAALRTLFAAAYAQPFRLAFAWDSVRIDHAGEVAWLFAEGVSVVTPDAGPVQRAPYRLAGVLQRLGPDWLWRQWTGSEPVKD